MREDEFLNPLAGIYFAGVQVPFGIDCDRVDPMKVPGHPTVVADGPSQCAGLSVLDPDLVIGPVRNENVLAVCVV